MQVAICRVPQWVQIKNMYDLKTADLQQVDLNIIGTVTFTGVFKKFCQSKKSGVIINISSASTERPLTRVVGCLGLKAAIISQNGCLLN
jgi:short-subunit dehydrogenase